MPEDDLNPGIVYVLGAGASHGDDLPISPPLLTEFFHGEFIARVDRAGADKNYEPVATIFEGLISDLSARYEFDDNFGEGRWRELNLELVFTDLAIVREFFGHDSRQGTKSQISMLLLKHYIRYILSVTTEGPATYSKKLVDSLRKCDSILSFNYDLLVDRLILERRPDHYANFHLEILGQPLAAPYEGRDSNERIYLKLHGSLNWLECTNRKCRMANTIRVAGSGPTAIDFGALDSCDTPYGLDWHQCRVCRSAMTPLLVPPLLHKQIMDNGVIRSVWGHAFDRLMSAAHIVIIGFSFQPTDFYAEWLFRNAALANLAAKIWVVDPKNSDAEFQARLRSIFQRDCHLNFTRFRQIGDLLSELNRC